MTTIIIQLVVVAVEGWCVRVVVVAVEGSSIEDDSVGAASCRGHGWLVV
jgi:hypothetical protein